MTAEQYEWRRLAGYRFEGILGAGGFGTVMAATRERDGLEVAIKSVHREDGAASKRLLIEAMALRAIGPPHVPAFYDQGAFPDDTPFIVIERLNIPSLDQMLGKPMPEEEFLPLADRILAALEATHAAGYLHRDLKPANIFLSDTPPVARLIDFGLARPLNRGEEPLVNTKEDTVLGTPIYMSPEQCAARKDIDHRSDIYSVGVVLYQMACGRTPFSGDPAEVRAAHVSKRPPPPSRYEPLSSALDDVLLRCLAKTPERRFATVVELREALTRALGSRESDTKPRTGPVKRRLAASGTTALVGVLYIEAQLDTGAVKRALTALGGQLVSVAGKRCIAIVGRATSGDPTQRALDVAQALINQGVSQRITVDRARLRIHRRKDGSERVIAAKLDRRDRFPKSSDPLGILVTASIVQSLAGLRTASVTGHTDIVRLLSRGGNLNIVSADEVPIVGRDDELAALLDSARAAVTDRRPTIATVLGDPGAGKSYLSATLAAQLHEAMPGAHVIQLRAREPISGNSAESLRQLLRVTLHLPDETPDDYGERLICAQLGDKIGKQVWPAVALTCGWLTARAPEVRKLSAAPTALRTATARAAGEALRNLTEHRPTVLLLDDGHFADETTLDAIEYATLAEAAVPLWIGVFAQPEFADARSLWGDRAARYRQIELDRLTDKQAATLCRKLLEPAENVPEQVITSMVAQTQGNPLLITELVRGVKAHGLIRKHARGEAWYLAADELDQLPELPRIEWLAERELAALPSQLADHARLIALLGPTFTVSDVEGVLRELEPEGIGEAFPLDAWIASQRLVERRLLVQHEGEQLGFRQALIRQQIARSAAPALAEHVHNAAFRYYGMATALPDHHRLPLLAHHAAHSGLLPTAAKLYRQLAEQAVIRQDYVSAELMYSRSIELLSGDDRKEHMIAYQGRGLMRCRLSRFKDALADLQAAYALAEELGERQIQAELLLDKATVLDWAHDYQSAKSLVDRAHALAKPDPPPLLVARLSLGMGRALFRLQQFERARGMLDGAAMKANSLGDEGIETLVAALMLMGYLLTTVGEIPQAGAIFETTIALCEERGDRFHLAAVLNYRHRLWLAEKQIARAVRDGVRARQIGREIGQLSVEYTTAYNLAELYFYAGDLDAAWPHIARAIELEPNVSSKPLARLLRARLLVLAGRLDEARRVAEDLRQAQARSLDQDDDDALFIESEEILLAMVELAVQAADRPTWDALCERARPVLGNIDYTELVEMMALSRLRDRDRTGARQLFEQALAACADTSHLIEDRLTGHLDWL